MPTSSCRNIGVIVDTITRLNPNKILDIGPGFGKFGVLCREYLELLDGRNEYKSWTRKVDCIEIFSEYLTDLHRFVYDNIYVGNASEIIGTLDQYDLILIIDVLEHFEKENGILFVNKCLNKSKNVLISIPKNISEQSDAFGNEFEIHKSKWSKNELKNLGNTYFVVSDESFIVLISDEETIRLMNKTLKMKKLEIILSIFLKLFPTIWGQNKEIDQRTKKER